MLTTLAKPEPYLFSVDDGEHVLVVRVVETSHRAALERFRAMDRGERRRAAVTRIADRRDSLGSLSEWFDRVLPAFARPRRVGV